MWWNRYKLDICAVLVVVIMFGSWYWILWLDTREIPNSIHLTGSPPPEEVIIEAPQK